jgi:phytoene dehydrogenase-like protein
MTSVDAVVVGAGHNGLVAANVLADAGWKVVVVESSDRAGRAIKSDESLHPGYVTDWYSAFYPLAAASPVCAVSSSNVGDCLGAEPRPFSRTYSLTDGAPFSVRTWRRRRLLWRYLHLATGRPGSSSSKTSSESASHY